MTPSARRQTAVELMHGRIHGAKLAADVFGDTDKNTGKDIYINRSKGLFGRSVFNDRVELPKTLIHENQHVNDFENRPSYLTPGQAYKLASEWYQKRAIAAETRDYVP